MYKEPTVTKDEPTVTKDEPTVTKDEREKEICHGVYVL